MKITFIGLSCFLLENSSGDRLLCEPYCDYGEYALGLKLPKHITADVFLVSHPDEDHSNLKHAMLNQKNPSNQIDTNTDSIIFPDFSLKGTLVREYNGDACIAFSWTIDNIRFLHLADNAHILSQKQLKEIGNIDILFIPMSKGKHNNTNDIISQLNPKVAICSHYIPVLKDIKKPKKETVLKEIQKLFSASWMKNARLSNDLFSHQVFTTLFLNALQLEKYFNNYKEINTISFKITKEKLPNQTTIMVFRDCLGINNT